MSEDTLPEGATGVYMEYTVTYNIHFGDDINVEDVVDWYIKYGMIHLTMKDGTVNSIEGEATWDSVDWKRGHMNVQFVNDDGDEVSE
jgi:hypothetical protein